MRGTGAATDERQRINLIVMPGYDRASQKDYLYIRKTIGYGAEGICVFYDEWE